VARNPSAPRPTPPARRPTGGTGPAGGGKGRAAAAGGSASEGPAAAGGPVRLGKSGQAAGGGRAASAADDGGFSRPYLVAAYTFLLLAGIGFGVVGSFLVPAGPRVGGLLLSYGVAVGLGGNAGLAVLGLWLTRARMGALLPLLGWGPVVMWLGSRRAEGDLILTGSAEAYVFLFAGAIAPVAVAILGRPTRGFTGLPTPVPAPARRATPPSRR
jgi:hypothetical protein